MTDAANGVTNATPATTFSDGYASRIITALEKRLDRKYKNGAFVHTTWATIGDVDTSGKEASAYLYGETDGAYMSEGFRVPDAMYVTVGDEVRVSMNYATGDRWIEEVSVPAYKKVYLDIANGQVVVGDGSDPANNVYLYNGEQGTLTVSSEGGDNTNLQIYGGTTRAQLQFKVAGDAYDRAQMRGDTIYTGIVLGSGASTPDMHIYRNSTPDLVLDAGDGRNVTVYKGQLNIDKGAGGEAQRSRIYFAPESNDPGRIEHYESSNTGALLLSPSDDRGSTDYIGFGSHPGSTWSEAVRIRTDGVFEFSGSSVERDTNLYRSAADVLSTDDMFEASRSTSTWRAISVKSDSDSGSRLYLSAGGTLVWGDGTGTYDTNLYRGSANNLTTDDSIEIGGSGAGYSHEGINLGAGGTIEVRAGSNPYIDFKIDSSDYGGRIIYNWSIADSFHFLGASGGYHFDYDITLSSGKFIGNGETWHTVTSFSNGWSDHGTSYGTVGYYKDAAGIVHLHGLIDHGTSGATAFTLPAGYRPVYASVFGTVEGTPYAAVRVNVQTDGQVQPYWGGGVWVALDTISFVAA